jgi:hypothetical protein
MAGANAAPSASATHGASGVRGQAAIELQQLAERLKDFSSAEILLALMMMRAGEKCEGCQGGSEALWGMLAGMAMAGQLAHACGQINSAAPAAGFEGGMGMSLNLQA